MEDPPKLVLSGLINEYERAAWKPGRPKSRPESYFRAAQVPPSAERPAKGGNKALKRAIFLAAFASLSNPLSRAYNDRMRAEGKKHNATVICLAPRRSDVIYAMLRDRQPYQP